MKKITLLLLIATFFSLSGNAQLVYDNTCTTSFDDISATGVDLMLGDDGEANITIPFMFTLDGISSSDLRVGNNGGVLFNITAGDVGLSSTPTAQGFYPFSDDLDSDYGAVLWETLGTAPNRRVVILWNDRPHYSNSASGATLELILYETTNEITFLYQDTDFGAGNVNNDAASAGIRVVGANGAYVYSTDTALGGVTCINWTIPNCSFPVATQTIVPDCASGEFSVDVDVTDLGDSTSLVISNSANSDTTPVTVAGTYTVGPFSVSSSVVITIAHENNMDCDLVFPVANYTTCPPTNDECATAIDVNCGDAPVVGSTAMATDSAGNSNGAKDVWYSYTGDGTPEDVTVSLCNSGYDTVLRVYTDCSVSAGAQILFNDDSCGTRSEGTFASDGTSTYYIMVEGYGTTAEGTYELTLSCAASIPAPANDLCSNAEALTIEVITPGTTAGATDNSTGGVDDTVCDPFSFKSDVWYTFVSPDADVSITTRITGDSDQANVAVYSSTDCTQLDADSIACYEGNAGESFDVTGLTGGSTYYVRVWSDGVAARSSESRFEGTFTIVVNNALLTINEYENANAFTYFPNPVKNELTLKAQSNIQNVSIYNMLGQEVLRTSPNALQSDVNMNQLQSGAYFVKVTINDSTETIRIIKQ